MDRPPANTPQARVGQRIRAARSARGISQAELARKTELDTVTVYRLEHGLTSQPQAETLQKVALALGVNVGWLMNGGQAPADITDEASPGDSVPLIIVELIISGRVSGPWSKEEILFLSQRYRDSAYAMTLPDLEIELLLERVRTDRLNSQRAVELQRAVSRINKERASYVESEPVTSVLLLSKPEAAALAPVPATAAPAKRKKKKRRPNAHGAPSGGSPKPRTSA